jgi:hypothetical protein
MIQKNIVIADPKENVIALMGVAEPTSNIKGKPAQKLLKMTTEAGGARRMKPRPLVKRRSAVRARRIDLIDYKNYYKL